VSLESITAVMPGTEEPSVYHAIRQSDYIHVLCRHQDGGIVVVRQFRPVVGQWTLEFPGGLRDGDEAPATAARREVEEETGLTVTTLIPLGDTFADVGRLTNQWYGFFAIVDGTPVSTEVGIEASVLPEAEIQRLAISGGLSIPGNIALMFLAASNSEAREACLRHGLTASPWTA
jgi:8-oxo-dGTP pyrophosphatase MutT (NUDIX family)